MSEIFYKYLLAVTFLLFSMSSATLGIDPDLESGNASSSLLGASPPPPAYTQETGDRRELTALGASLNPAAEKIKSLLSILFEQSEDEVTNGERPSQDLSEIPGLLNDLKSLDAALVVDNFDPRRVDTLEIVHRARRPNDSSPNRMFIVRDTRDTYETTQRDGTTKGPKSAGEVLSLALEVLITKVETQSQVYSAVTSYKVVKPADDQVWDSLYWDSLDSFLLQLDKALMEEKHQTQRQKCGSTSWILAKGCVAVLIGGGAPLPINGIILVSMGNIFGFPPGQWISNTLSAWIMATLLPVAIRQTYKRVGIPFNSIPFTTDDEDEARYTRALKEVTIRKTNALKESKRVSRNDVEHADVNPEQGDKLTFEEEIQIGREAEKEVGQDWRSKPHVHKKSILHWFVHSVLAGSSSLNALIPTAVVIDVYSDFDRVQGFPFGYFAASFVFAYYFQNYFDIGERNLWNVFAKYRYMGYGQTRHRLRQILIERIRENKLLFADSRYKDYTMRVFNEIEEIRSKLNKKDDSEERISAVSLLFLKDKVRNSSDDNQRQGTNFQKDLDILPSGGYERFLDLVAAGVVGVSMFADVEILRFTLKQICIQVFQMDEINAGEIAAITVVSIADTMLFRAWVEFPVHSENIKKLLRVVTFRNIFDFKWIRKGIGAISSVNGILHSFPKLYVGWRALSGFNLFDRIFLLLFSTINSVSLNQAIFSGHYNGMLTDAVTLPTHPRLYPLQVAKLNNMADELIEYVRNIFDDETVGRLYQAIQDKP